MTSIGGRGVKIGSERRASRPPPAGMHARVSGFNQPKSGCARERVVTLGCPTADRAATRIKCEPSQVDTGREPRGESDVRDGRHTCDGFGERDHMRERPQMHVHREGDSREIPQMHTERRFVSVVGARVPVHCAGHACGKDVCQFRCARHIMSDETEACDGPAHDG